MRLGDLDALKAKVELMFGDKTHITESVCELIDNAPTVEPEKVLIANVSFDENKLKEIIQTEVIDKIKSGELVLKTERSQDMITNDDIQQATKEGFANGYEMAKEKFSPKKGEWIVKTISTFPQYQPDEYICPFCNTIVNYKTDFCHKCGSDMRGGAEND